MKDPRWELFEKTGLPQAWLLYKKMEEREHRDGKR